MLFAEKKLEAIFYLKNLSTFIKVTFCKIKPVLEFKNPKNIGKLKANVC